jgi:predicted aspartyl protease
MTLVRGLGALLFGLGLGLSLAGTNAHAQCAPQLLTSVATSALPDGRFTIPAAIEGRAFSFLVDTGGISTTVKWEMARDLKLPVKQTTRQLKGVGGSVLNFAITGENFSIGDLKLRNKPIYVESRPIPFADGTLSADILRDYDVEIDIGGGRFALFQSGHCAAPDWGAVLAMEVAQSGHVRFPVKVDGKTVIATLDTGAAVSVIGMNAARGLGVYQGSPELSPVAGRGRFQLYSYPFQTLELGGVTVKYPQIAIANDGFLPGDGSDLVLGIDALAGLKLTIAYGQNRLYISAPQAN